jgi:hypothetical protein
MSSAPSPLPGNDARRALASHPRPSVRPANGVRAMAWTSLGVLPPDSPHPPPPS